MKEFSFLGTWNDSWGLLAEILDGEEFTAVLDVKCGDANPAFVSKLSQQVKATLKDRRRLFIWGKKYSLFPPFLEEIGEGPNAGKYFVRLAKGGPGLELTLPACYEKGGLINLGPGTLSCPQETFNPKTSVWERPSHELKKGFQEVKVRIKRHLVKYKVRPQVWIGQEALNLVEENKAIITGFELAT